MKALVIGYGSIGSRHARILAELGCQVAVVSSRKISFEPRYASIADAIKNFAPEYVVVASETSRHTGDVKLLSSAGFRGLLLVEKPLSHVVESMQTEGFSRVYVAYNLRFHPLVQKLKELLQHETVISVQAYVGQYLPEWRPDRNYRNVYSADKHAGGGVLRDLSHELDLLNWLFGGWRKLTALGGHFSSLEISSDDLFAILMTFDRCPVATLEVNYLDRPGRRRIMVNTDENSYEADFITGQLLINGVRESLPTERDQTYLDMHRAILDGDRKDVCRYDEGLDVMGMIVAAEYAVEKGQWLTR